MKVSRLRMHKHTHTRSRSPKWLMSEPKNLHLKIDFYKPQKYAAYCMRHTTWKRSVSRRMHAILYLVLCHADTNNGVHCVLHALNAMQHRKRI